jgi:hypothetical protein
MGALIKVVDELFSRAANRSSFQCLVDGKLTGEIAPLMRQREDFAHDEKGNVDFGSRWAAPGWSCARFLNRRRLQAQRLL